MTLMDAAVITGIFFVVFSTLVFIYFTAWTFYLPFVKGSSVLHAIYPDRFWLYSLPFIGVVGLTSAIGIFMAWHTRSEKKKK